MSRKEKKVLFKSSSIRSFFLYYLVGCTFVLGCAFLFQYLDGDTLFLNNIITSVLTSTGIVLVACPIILLRKIEVYDERLIIRWSLFKKRKSIPFGLVEHMEKSNFLATPAIKVFFKNGKVEKIPFVDKSNEMLSYLNLKEGHLMQNKACHRGRAA